MKISFTIIIITLFSFSQALYSQSSAKTENKKVNRPLKNINYMGVNARIGAGFNSPKLSTSNDWTATSGVPYYFGFGYNFTIKNSWAFDLQITEELASYELSNKGPFFKTNYMTTGAEIGVKKTFAKKPDNTFFFRAAFGYNFLIIANKTGGSEYYSYSTSSAGSNMYALPEIGYQLRLADARHLINFSVNYKYSLSAIATTQMTYFNTVEAPEPNSFEMKGSFAGVNVSYVYIIKAFEDNSRTGIKVDSHF